MGGRPYGRPMAMTDDDLRDGLALDRLELAVGPFFPPFPPGLVLEIALQGDVVQTAAVVRRPFAQPAPEVFRRALRELVPVSELEAARAGRLLRRVARMLRVAGAGALADRALFLTVTTRARPAGGPVGPRTRATPGEVRRLRVLLRCGGSLAALGGVGGRSGADVGARLGSWIDGAERALERAADARGSGASTGTARSLRALAVPFDGEPDPDEALGLLPELLPGLEWGEAVVLVASLRLAPDTEPGLASR